MELITIYSNILASFHIVVIERRVLPNLIKALKTLVWHLSREPMTEITSLKK